MTHPRVVLLCCDGLYQRYLATRLASSFNLIGIVIRDESSTRPGLVTRLARYRNPLTLVRYLEARLFLPRLEQQAETIRRDLFYTSNQLPTLPTETPSLRVTDINAPEVVDFVSRLQPDIVCVNGTNLLREPMLALISSIPLGIVNLHTGLSPYARGGNCNLFMLLEGLPEYVGITIHHINPGIDSGDIIITARPALHPNDNYEMIDAKTFRLGIDAMVIAVQQLQQGCAQRVSQWTRGKLFLRRTGYVYDPYQRLRVNQRLRQGLISSYLSNQQQRDHNIRLIGTLA